MTNERKTDWYPGHIRPIRSGVYERQLPFDPATVFSYYDATTHHWYGDYPSALLAGKYTWHTFVSREQRAPWRGMHLRHDPREGKQERRK